MISAIRSRTHQLSLPIHHRSSNNQRFCIYAWRWGSKSRIPSVVITHHRRLGFIINMYFSFHFGGTLFAKSFLGGCISTSDSFFVDDMADPDAFTYIYITITYLTKAAWFSSKLRMYT
jgi:hypothetical protein